MGMADEKEGFVACIDMADEKEGVVACMGMATNVG